MRSNVVRAVSRSSMLGLLTVVGIVVFALVKKASESKRFNKVLGFDIRIST
jgi:hypothetical protein